MARRRTDQRGSGPDPSTRLLAQWGSHGLTDLVRDPRALTARAEILGRSNRGGRRSAS